MAYSIVMIIAFAVLILGLAHKVRQYWRTPAPLKIATTPAPTSGVGVLMRMAREVLLFESLFKANKWTWIFGYLFHFALVLVLARHLRYFTEPVWTWVVMIQPFGKYAGFVMVISIAGLWLRRLFVDRVRYISSPSDHLMLILLVAIGLSGLGMKYVAHTDIVALKAFTLGLMYFDWQPLPSDLPLLVHLSLVIILMLIFPFSKLLHAPGVFFSPTRNMRDNPREHRHVAPWARNLPDRADGA